MEECNIKAAAPEAFEFPSSSASSAPMICIAGDIISGGKLLPFCASTDHPPPPAVGSSRVRRTAGGYRKLRKEEQADPNPVSRRKKQPAARSRWYVLAFGFRSAAMELKEIRRRIIRLQQVHKSPESMAEQVKEKKKKEWGPCKLLRSLSCCMYM